MAIFRVNVEVSEEAWERLNAAVARRVVAEGRGKQFAKWRIVQELLMTLPPPHKTEAEKPRRMSRTA